MCWVFGVGFIFGKINSVAGCWIRCLKHCLKHHIMFLEVLLVRQACAFSFMRVSLSWIISCALRKVLFSKHIFCLKDCFGNYCEDWKKIYFQNISNLLEKDMICFYFVSWIFSWIWSSEAHVTSYIYMEGAKPSLAIVHAVLFFV